MTRFFNTKNTGSFKLPTSVLHEMVAAGFKRYTVAQLMATYSNEVELSNYLATALRVTQVERDVIAHLMIKQRTCFIQALKQEERD